MPVKKESVRAGFHEVTGMVLLAVCVLGILSLFSYDPQDVSLLHSPPNSPPSNFIGPVGAWLGFLTFMTFGVGGYLVPAALAYLGLLCFYRRDSRIWPKVIWTMVVFLALCCLLELGSGAWEALTAKINSVGAGGVAGDIVGRHLLVGLMGSVGAGIVCVALLLVSLVMLFEISPTAVVNRSREWIAARMEKRKARRRDQMDDVSKIEDETRELSKRQTRLERAVKTYERATAMQEKPAAADEPAPAKKTSDSKSKFRAEPESDPVVSPRAASRDAEEADAGVKGVTRATGESARDDEADVPPLVEQAVDLIKKVRARSLKAPAPKADPEPVVKPASLPAPNVNFTLPSLDLLDPLPPLKDREIQGDFELGSQLLKETLSEFGIEVEVTNVERGPVVTRYELLPAAGVRVERITNLSNNIGLAMKAESVRVQAPIPGKGVVGIEISNPKTSKVFLRELMESDEWKNSPAALPLALGKDVGGHALIADLAKMPHMLVAGATGSGKTVCMNSILAGLLMSRTPDQLKLMLIDPKIVEFSNYNHLPHLVVPVITDSKKVSLGLRWAITEMEKRYKLFARVGVRNIESFNSRPIVKQQDLFAEGVPAPEEEEEDKIPDRVPYIVIVVDELADLMLVAQAEIENHIARLAQLSRAVGIHMILATQRPSVNVITGTIKANFPARIAFQVAQANDSRTILDSMGADKLLGKGDMLFLNPGLKQLIRAQGTLTLDAEIARVVEHLKAQGQPQYEMAVKDKIEGKTTDLPDMEESDELIEQAMEIIRQTRRASTSSLQRRLRIGYTRAARIMDLLEQKGIVGPAQGSDPREILIDLDGEVPTNEEEPNITPGA